ncbi:clathrin adaptor complex small chain subfamily protein [Acanthamoeba castellanii str. Neff]|uniref:Clathrin adaptor complex small chain subfamily protein n=1 Tax=Acanthamoeba castellanii (strain ATCC 30010 / Neff) TaxID=1257118 RepID=L8GDI8_ACACF|nr:clathrin adaptor complex small chain subfamily protein [Acanthamoeba castellanii str. Neff]ELR11082.1 clathrin adaptor complex small chain subfamily protein [Acanthamoeba castellanii str. Neff]
MISAIFVLNSRGDVLISRLFRDDVSRGVADTFRLQVINAKEVRSPISSISGTSLLHVRSGDIYLLAATKQNVDCALVFSLLNQLVLIFRSYFGGKFDEDHIRKNFVLIYELLDEVIDYGHPQNSDIEALKLYITQAKNKNKLAAVAAADDDKIRKITVQVTGAGPCPWRQPGIKYRKNELFIDVIESVNLLISAKGNASAGC